MIEYDLFFECEPVAKGRPRFTRTGHAYTPEKTAKYEKYIKDYYEFKRGKYIPGPVEITLVFNMPIPKSFSRKVRRLIEDGDYPHVSRPDCDNLAKAVLDALNGVAFEDDKMITKLSITKRYSTLPGVWIKIKEVCK